MRDFKTTLRELREGKILLDVGFDDREITDDMVKAFVEAVPDGRSFVALSFVGNALTDSAAINLSRINTHILILNDNNIGNAGAKALAANPYIRKLYLRNNKIGDEGAAAFKDNNTLRELLLDNNAIGDTGLLALAQSRSHCLRTVTLCNNPYTKQGLRVLEKNMPCTADFRLDENKVAKKTLKKIEQNSRENRLALRKEVTECVIAIAQGHRQADSPLSQFPKELLLKHLLSVYDAIPSHRHSDEQFIPAFLNLVFSNITYTEGPEGQKVKLPISKSHPWRTSIEIKDRNNDTVQFKVFKPYREAEPKKQSGLLSGISRSFGKS